LNESVRAALGPEGSFPLALVLLGNPWRGDDAVGPFLAERLSGRLDDRCVLIPAFERPEEAWEAAVACRPRRVVMVDAADFGGRPGEIRVTPPAGSEVPPLSTHRFPVEAVARLIEADTGAPVLLLLVQAAACRLGTPPTEAVRATAQRLADYLETLYAREPSGR